jgi:hypothetical protein
MPRVVEHHDHPMGEEVASSAPHASHRLPSVAAKELLRNRPDLAASPDVLRQWRDDIDHLLNLAQITPGSARGSASR